MDDILLISKQERAQNAGCIQSEEINFKSWFYKILMKHSAGGGNFGQENCCNFEPFLPIMEPAAQGEGLYPLAKLKRVLRRLPIFKVILE